MVTSETSNIAKAAVAQSEEIQRLSQFLGPYQGPRPFNKDPGELSQGPRAESLPTRPTPEGRRTAFHHLRDELGLLLGPAGSNLVLQTWNRYQLSPMEVDPTRLRCALLPLFSAAARLAAPRGSSQPLQALVRAFEADYFAMNGTEIKGDERGQRFTLLGIIQTGQGANLLPTVLGGPHRPSTSPPSQSKSGEERARLRREFLFESSCRARNWSEAYRHGRILSSTTPPSGLGGSLGKRLGDVYRESMLEGPTGSKKKQLLADIARLPFHSEQQALHYALSAVSAVGTCCRPGGVEEIVLAQLPPSDPRWPICLSHLMRHRPVVDNWTSTFRQLWQHEPGLRPFCRLLFALLRFSRTRAEATLAVLPELSRADDWQTGQVRGRVERGRQEVALWNRCLMSRGEALAPLTEGSPVLLEGELWDHVMQVAARLEIAPPGPIRVLSNIDQVKVVSRPGKPWQILVNPEVLAGPRGETRFLLARALYRHATGLDLLEPRGHRLGQSLAQALAQTIAYAERQGHQVRSLPLDGPLDPVELQVGLEELYWQTEDPIYALLGDMLVNRCWCPRAEFEADRFGRLYCNPIEAAYSVLRSGTSDLTLTARVERVGFTALLAELRTQPTVVLRLQSLWVEDWDQARQHYQM